MIHTLTETYAVHPVKELTTAANRHRLTLMGTIQSHESSASVAHDRRYLAFWIAIASVVIFYDGFWLRGYRVNAFDKLSEDMGNFQFILWYVSFFFASFIPLKPTIKERAVIKCLVVALAFSFALYCLMIFSTFLFGPYLDPWF